MHKVSSSSKIYLIQLVNFLDFLEDSCIFHFEDVCLESLLYLIVFVALSSHSASSFPLEIISPPPHSLCTAKQNVCLTNVSAVHFQSCPLGKFK